MCCANLFPWFSLLLVYCSPRETLSLTVRVSLHARYPKLSRECIRGMFCFTVLEVSIYYCFVLLVSCQHSVWCWRHKTFSSGIILYEKKGPGAKISCKGMLPLINLPLDHFLKVLLSLSRVTVWDHALKHWPLTNTQELNDGIYWAPRQQTL